MKGFSSFGAPEGRRFDVEFDYNARPSFWGRVGSNAHLFVAGIGTAALLGVAAVALWLALPAAERQANASPKQPVEQPLDQIVPARPVKTTKVVPPSKKPVQAAAAAAKAEPPATHTTPKGDAVSPKVAAADASVSALAPNDPRWSKPASAAAPKAAASQAEVEGQSASSASEAAQAATGTIKTVAAAADAQPDQTALAPSADAAAAVRAEPPSKAKSDVYQTAAIPAIKPGVPEPAANDDAEANAPRTEPAKPESHTERVQSGVTMRSGPKNEASAITTIPAKTPVQVVSCDGWCEIIYKGRRGFIYKSFLGRGDSSRPKPTKVSAPAQPKQPAAAPAPAKPDAAQPKEPVPGAGTFAHK